MWPIPIQLQGKQLLVREIGFWKNRVWGVLKKSLIEKRLGTSSSHFVPDSQGCQTEFNMFTVAPTTMFRKHCNAFARFRCYCFHCDIKTPSNVTGICPRWIGVRHSTLVPLPASNWTIVSSSTSNERTWKKNTNTHLAAYILQLSFFNSRYTLNRWVMRISCQWNNRHNSTF